jgi:transposase
VVLEATYGWYWAVDVLQEIGARVHLAHPLGVKGFAYRRVMNDQRDATDVADLLRMGRLPEAYVAPPAVRQLRELVRHRAKLVALRSGLKAGVHGVLAKQGVHIPVTDLFGVGGRRLLAAVGLDGAYLARVNAYCRLIDAVGFEIDAVSGQLRARLCADPGYTAIQQVPGVGPVLAAVFVAEIGEAARFPDAARLVSWAGLTPRHRESDTTVRRGRTHEAGQRPGPVGGDRGGAEDTRLGRLAGHQSGPDRAAPRPQRRHRRGRSQAAHPGLLRTPRRTRARPRPGGGMTAAGRGSDRLRGRGRPGPRRQAAWPRG